MKRCSSPAHPHCTVWVQPGADACAHGHAQPQEQAGALGSSFDMLSRLRADRDGADAIRPRTEPAPPAPLAAPAAARPHAQAHPQLHVSGFDPRAAGGRHALKLELRGMPDGVPARLTMLLQSELLADGGVRQEFVRSLRGDFRPVFIEFSSRGREHGQYRIDVELHARADGASARSWVATLVLLVPRADASLGEIHQTFLSTHKNVRISADDGSIARLHGLDAAGPMDIDIQARNAAIAQVYFDAAPAPAGGRVAVPLPTLAWDEDLIEIDQPQARAHPAPAAMACLVHAEPDAGAQRHLRLFALDECVLGRFETAGAEADLLLQHFGEHGPQRDGLTRRLSGRHALIRAVPQAGGRAGFEIEDVSRYGILLDGAWPGKHVPVPLRLGMRIELTASIRGVVTLVVSALSGHALVLHRVDGGGAAESFMLLAPGVAPQAAADARPPEALPRAAGLPLLFHRDGGFWHRDPASGQDTALTPASALERLAGFHGRVRFSAGPRPEDVGTRTATGERRRAPPSVLHGA